MAITRRDMLNQTAAGLVLVSVADTLVWMAPAAAAASGTALRSLTSREAAWLDRLASAIALPTRGAGFSRFIDHHVTVPHAESLLALRYLDVAPPYLGFYRAGVAALTAMSGADTPPESDARWTDILGQLSAGGGAQWQGPPAQLFLFAVRLDAIDIAYGTRAGFERLGVDYLPHVEPERDW